MKNELQPVIYLLRDPRDRSIRYVGYAKNLLMRMHWHFNFHRTYKPNQTGAGPWIRELAVLGFIPLVEVVEWVHGDCDWQASEKFWIAHFRNLGEPLLNKTKGGVGGNWGWSELTPEQRSERVRKYMPKSLEGTKRYWADKPIGTRRKRTEKARQGMPVRVSKWWAEMPEAERKERMRRVRAAKLAKQEVADVSGNAEA